MDVNALHSCFSATLSADVNDRRRAELQLREAEKAAGFISGCMDIVMEPQVGLNVKQAAGIYMKNKVTKYWNPLDKATPLKISEDEKPSFREKIIPALIKVDPRVRPHIVTTLNAIVAKDFPDTWTGLMDQTMNLFQSNDVEATKAGLTCLLEICRFYKWSSGDVRVGLDRVIDVAFPGVLNIGNQLVNEDSTQAAEMLRDVVKIYKMATYHILPMAMRNRDSLVGWGTLFLQIIKKDLPQEVMNLDEDEREKHAWVKSKKWAYGNLHRLLYRYATKNVLKDQEHEHYQFGNMYVNNFVPEILQVFFEQITLWIQKQIWIGEACLYNMLSFFDRCVEAKSTWDLIKPHTGTMISHVIFPLLCPTESDMEMFEDDPEEYIRRRIDIFDETPTADIAATNFLGTLVRVRRKSTFTPMLQFVQGILDKQLQNPQDLELCKEKEGALRMMSQTYMVVLGKNSPIADKMEGFIAQHVFPDFSSPYHFLRARACEFLNRYATITFTDSQNISHLYQSVIRCMNDEYMPVQIEAALALQPLISHEEVRSALSTKIPEVMQHLLDLSKKVDIDAISGVMEEFVEVFAEQLAPFAVQLAEQMRDQFLKMIHELVEKQNVPIDEIDFDDFASEDKTMAASGILTTLSSLLLALEHAPELVAKLEDVLMPVFASVLENSMSEFYTEIFGLVENCTFCLKRVSPNMWQVFRLMHKAFDGLGLDYFDDMSPCLDEIIQCGSEQMRADPSLSHIMFDIIRLVFAENERMGATDKTYAGSLAQKMLIALKGTIDELVPQFLEIALNGLANGGDKLKNIAYHVTLLEMVVAAMYYNPTATIQFLESKHYTAQFFSTWFNQMNHFTRVQDKKLAALGIMSVMTLPQDQIPQQLQSNLPQLAKGLVNIMGTLPKAIADREELNKTFADDSFYEGDHAALDAWEDEYEEDDDDDTNEGVQGKAAANEYLEFLEESASKLENASGYYDEDDEGLDEEPLVESPLDHINTYVVFRDTFHGLQASDQARYQLLTSQFSDSDAQIVQSTCELANMSESGKQQ